MTLLSRTSFFKKPYLLGLFLSVIILNYFSLVHASSVEQRPLPGYWNSAHYGGLTAYSTQTAAFWSNPSGLNLKQSQKLELSTFNLAENSGIMASWALPAGKYSTLGLALQASELENFNTQQARAGFGVRPAPNLSIGIIGVGQQYQDTLFMDFNLGAQYSFTDYFKSGVVIQNLTEKLTPALDSNNRHIYGAGFAWFPMYARHKEAFMVHLDWESEFLAFRRNRWILGTSYAMGPRENLRLSTAISRQDLGARQPISASLGVKVQEVFFKSFLSFYYTVSHVPIAQNNDGRMRHQLGTALQLYPKQDRTPPTAQARMSRNLFDFKSPDTTWHQASFILNAQDDSKQFKSWHLVIAEVDQNMKAVNVIKSFNGKGQPPKKMKWDGRDNSGSRLPVGFYTYRVIVLDKESNHAATSWQFFEVR